ncbi:MAG: hypothetical protein IKL68_00725 [Clostridia bacterium]|nr:hypothetical protein [Clostridia bacterium]
MKKGISLIVLVITIIVMIIIAGAIIISLNSTSVIEKANDAVTKTDVGTLNDKLTLAYVDVKATYPTTSKFDTTTKYTINGAEHTGIVAYYNTALTGVTIPTGYSLEVLENGSAQIVETAKLNADRLNK